jgi:hypothetical protein
MESPYKGARDIDETAGDWGRISSDRSGLREKERLLLEILQSIANLHDRSQFSVDECGKAYPADKIEDAEQEEIYWLKSSENIPVKSRKPGNGAEEAQSAELD